MIDYILKSILCLLVLGAFYKIALEQVSAHQFKRFYLLASLFIAAILPLITITYAIEVEPQPVLQNLQVVENDLVTAQEVVSQEKPFNWAIALWAIYGAGVLLFGFRFTRNLLGINSKINHNEQVKESTHVNVLLHQKITPHSFLKYIFLPKQEFKDHRIAPEVLAHERAHVEQKHSWDILLIEFFQVVFWFNPLIHFYKKSIALNHEFLADRATIKNYKNIDAYVHQLFRYSGGTDHTALASSLNYSLTKKRIIMLSNKFSARKLALRLGLLLPVLALCVYLFNEEIVAKPVFTESGMANTQIESSNSGWTEIYVDPDKTIWIENNKISQADFKSELAKLTKDEKYKVKLNLQSTIEIDEIDGLFDDLKDAGVENLVIHSLIEALEPAEDASQKQIEIFKRASALYAKIEKASVKEQLASSYSFRVTWNNWGSISPDEPKRKNEADVTGYAFPPDEEFDEWKSSNKYIFQVDEIETPKNEIKDISEYVSFLKVKLPKDQRKSTEEYLIKLKTPPVLTQAELNQIYKNPTASQINEWKDASKYGVWVDHKRIQNKDLKDEKEYIYYFISKLEKNAKNYGKHYYQINLMTPAYYESHKKIQNPPTKEEIEEYIEQKEKVLNITVTGSEIYVNGKETTVDDFAKSVDAVTIDWTADEIKDYSIHFRSNNAAIGLWKKLDDTFKTTALYKANPKSIIPPPPPPAPAPPKAGNNPPPPPPPPAPKPKTVSGYPPPPPPPPSPEQMMESAEDIYFNGKKISKDKASKLFKNADQYNIMFKNNSGKKILTIAEKKGQ